MGIIKIRGLEISACHGVHGFEKENTQPFIFDADLYYDFYGAAKTDCIEGTINYSAACGIIADITLNNSFNLIEKLAYECAFGILDGTPAERVELTVYKPQAPVKHKFGSVGVSVDVRRERAYLSLGSSLGDRKKYLDTALEKLNKTRGIKVKKVSSYIATEPYGGVAENTFLNCAAEVETYLTPRGLLEEIHRIEAECGRVRDKHWSDRTLDIDIIFFGKYEVCEDDLVIPHPEYAKRAFVTEPLKEIAPDFVCPVTKKRIKDL